MPEDSLPPAIGIPIAILLVLLNGFFVAAEFAIVRVRRTRLAELAGHGHPIAAQVQAILHHLDTYLAATQLGITMASLGLGWIGEPAVAAVLAPLFHGLLGVSMEVVEVVSFGLGFALITVLHITLGELAPKSVAILHPDAASLVVAWPLRLFATAMWPAIWALNGTSNLLLRLVGLRVVPDTEPTHSEEELRLLLASSGEHGVLDPIERELASRSLALGELSVRQVMVPRTEMDALPADLPLEEARRRAIAAGHGRLPVYQRSPDDVIGYVEWNDLFVSDRPTWIDRVRPLPALPESLSASQALARLRQEEAHLGLVLDEYGGTAGILTVRDILDEIARRELAFEPAIVPGSTPLHLLRRLPGLELADEKATTLGGYVTARLGRLPVAGERVAAGAWDMVVVQADDHRVISARLARRGPAGGAKAGR
ncbi:MAG TPA: hemolysin family protein [Candidatus Dormibacteraeota bacterium]|jgi:CBS domain containing-hemolysin-like protein|nr:hemolysin family protein [Candidatus Dormibacteraeota bacterium]